jgi:hypothetical protein
MTKNTIRWIEIDWKVLDTINDNRSTFGSTEVVGKAIVQCLHREFILIWARFGAD